MFIPGSFHHALTLLVKSPIFSSYRYIYTVYIFFFTYKKISNIYIHYLFFFSDRNNGLHRYSVKYIYWRESWSFQTSAPIQVACAAVVSSDICTTPRGLLHWQLVTSKPFFCLFFHLPPRFFFFWKKQVKSTQRKCDTPKRKRKERKKNKTND